MRKVILFMMVSLDGFFEGPNHAIDWHNVDAEFNEFAIHQLNEVDTLLFGRRTYELMASYWPTPTATTNDPIVAERMNNLPKIVVSRTLQKVEWNNSRLIRENVAEEISKLKQQPGKDMAIFGSSNLSLTLTRLGLIDEYRVIREPCRPRRRHKPACRHRSSAKPETRKNKGVQFRERVAPLRT